MTSTRDIRNKIKTVRSIEQICRAMKTVSSIRLRRAEQRLDRSRSYHDKLGALVESVAAITQAHPFLAEGRPGPTGLLVVTSDRGLCGGYNAAAMRAAFAAAPPSEAVAIAVGRRGLVQFRTHGYEIADQLAPLGGEPEVPAVHSLADRIGQRYLDGAIGRLVVVYTKFLGGTRTEVRTDVVLPVKAAEREVEERILEPPPAEMLPGLMRRHLRSKLLSAVLESATSEHAARVAAMTAATDNAEEMIQQLTLEYNKARQSAITKELIEIVSAAGAAA
ncbi:MAG: ATP synthase F1 subunit gamma [Armatimonadota bacterium]